MTSVRLPRRGTAIAVREKVLGANLQHLPGDLEVFSFSEKSFIVLTELRHLFQEPCQMLSDFSQSIFYLRRICTVVLPVDDPIRLHLPQALRKHLLGYPLKRTLKFIKSPGTSREIADDEKLPFASNEAHCRRYRAIRQFFFRFH